MNKGKWITGMLAAGSAVVAANAAAGVVMAERTLRRHPEPGPVSPNSAWAPYAEKIRRGCEKLLEEYPPEYLSITARDGLTLKAKLFTPVDADKLAILVHGYCSNGFSDFGGTIIWYYLQRGWRVLLVDDRAHGESDGDWIGFGTLDRHDVYQWIKYSAIRFGTQMPIVLHGMSMGAATVMMTAGLELPEQVKGIVEDCGFTSAWEEFSHVLRKRLHFSNPILLRSAELWTKCKAGYDYHECSALEEIKKATVPVCFIHGGADDFVPTWMSEAAYEVCPTEKMKYICPGAGHAMSWVCDPEKYAEVLDTFFETAL